MRPSPRARRAVAHSWWDRPALSAVERVTNLSAVRRSVGAHRCAPFLLHPSRPPSASYAARATPRPIRAPAVHPQRERSHDVLAVGEGG
jgi:hypothetical protein